MKKIIKITGWGFGVFVALIIITGIAIKIIVTKDFIATKIEEAINGRVEIRDISVPIWAAFSGISVDGFKIANKDAEMQKPMKDRAPITSEVIGFERFEFKVAVGKLIKSFGKEFELKSLLLIKPKAAVVLYENGSNNIMPLLVKPQETKPESNDKPKEDVKATEAKKEAKKEVAAAKVEPAKQNNQPVQAQTTVGAKKAFSIKSAPGIIKMGKIGMENGQFTVNIQKIQNTLYVDNVSFLLKDVFIDPKNLNNPERNKVNMVSSLNLELKENKKADSAVSSFLFLFSSNGTIQPFQPETGEVAEFMVVEAIFHKGTKMTGLAAFKKLKGSTEQLNKIGINLDFLKDDILLSSDSKVKVEYNYGKVTFLNDLVINTEDSSMVAEAKSWVNINSYDHLINGSIRLAPNHTKTIEGQVDDVLRPGVNAIVGGLPANIRSTLGDKLNVETMRNNILKPARDEQNRILLGFQSSGKLTSPSVAVTRPEFPSAKDVVAQEGKKVQGDAGAIVKGQAEQAKKQATESIKQETKKATDQIQQEAAQKLKKLF